MYSYLITYRTGYNQENLVEMPSLWKLLLWVLRNAANCPFICIQWRLK